MKKLFVLVAVMVLVMAASCDTLNIGNGNPTRGPVIEGVTITPATTMNAGEMATVTVTWTGTAPFTISIDVGTAENVPAGTDAGTSPYTWEFTLEEGATFNYTVTVVDVNGEDTMTGTYGPVGAALNEMPTIEGITEDNGVVTVTVADAEGDDVTVTATAITGATLAVGTQTVAGGNGDAVFTFTADDAFAGATGTTTIAVTDTEHTDTVTQDQAVEIDPISVTLDEGQIGAIPLSTSCAVGDVVTILVRTGTFPAGAAFNYMNGVGVTVTDGGDYVAGTFNVGSVGGATKDVDGIWAEMTPAPNTFFVPEDFMMAATDVTADSSLDFMGFNITPIGAGEVSVEGDLFNFGMDFDAAGTYELGFLEFQDVKRTYYSDNAAVEYNWTDIANGLDVSTTITVN